MVESAHPYTILVAVQNDDASDAAIVEAFRAADARPDAELHAVHVLRSREQSADAAVAKLDQRLQDAPKVLLEVLERSAPKDSQQRVLGHIRAHADPARGIVQMAADIQADLVVMGTHRRRGVEKMLLGSVAEKVLHDTHCPVLVVIPKDYEGTTVSASIAPPCPSCVALRRETKGEKFWCEQHLREYHHPHIYVPSDQRRNSVLPTH